MFNHWWYFCMLYHWMFSVEIIDNNSANWYTFIPYFVRNVMKISKNDVHSKSLCLVSFRCNHLIYLVSHQSFSSSMFSQYCRKHSINPNSGVKFSTDLCRKNLRKYSFLSITNIFSRRNLECFNWWLDNYIWLY